MSKLGGREMPLAIAFVAAMLGSIGYFLDFPIISEISSVIEMWAIIIVTFTLGIGVISAIRSHGSNIYKRSKEMWPYSVVVLGSMLLMMITGLFGTINNPIFIWMYTYVEAPLKMAILGILFFFITSATYRAFKAKTFESTVFLVSAVFTMLKNAPIGSAIWVGFEDIGLWILNYPGSAGMRGIIIAAGIGLISFSLLTITGTAKGWLSKKES